MTVGLRIGGVVLATSLLAAAVRAQQPEKNPVPDVLTQEESRKAAADLYQDDFAAAKGNKQALVKLAQKMLGDAAKAKNDGVAYYVLLDLAKDIATGAGDVGTAMSALDRIGESYDVDILQAKADCLKTIGTSRTGDTDYKTLAQQAFSLVDEAVARNDYLLAKHLAEMARAGSRRARHYTLAKEALARGAEIEEAGTRYSAYQESLKVLEDDPTNPEANLAAGRYLCLHKGDWERGIPMLALGSDQVLKTAAEKELQPAFKANEQLALAEAWWQAAERGEREEKEALMLRAGGWYEQAKRSGVSGMAEIKIDNRLRQIAKIDRPAPKKPIQTVRQEKAVPDDRGQEETVARPSQLEQWRTVVSDSGWQWRPLAAMAFRVEQGTLYVRNTTGKVAALTNSIPLKGDFVIDVEFIGPSLCIRSLDAANQGICFEGRADWSKATIRRNGETVQCEINGERVRENWSVGRPGGDYFFAITTDPGKLAAIRKFVIRKNALADSSEGSRRVPGPDTTKHASTAAKEIKPGQPTEILSTVDTSKHAVRSVWSRNEDGITGARSHAALLMIPVEIRGSYQLDVTFTRNEGSDLVSVVLPVGDRGCSALFSAAGGSVGCIDRIDGDNDTIRRPCRLTNGKRYSVTCQVQLRGHLAAIRVLLDGQPYFEWTGDQRRLSNGHERQLPQPRHAGLYTHISQTTFHSVQLKMVDGIAVRDPDSTR